MDPVLFCRSCDDPSSVEVRMGNEYRRRSHILHVHYTLDEGIEEFIMVYWEL
jgi:hypothetical protein